MASLRTRVSRLESGSLVMDRLIHGLEKVGELKLAREGQLYRSDLLRRAHNIVQAKGK